MPDPSRILIIRPSALGDVCRTVPVLASLRRAFPEAEIDWLVQDSFVDAVWYHPALTHAVPFPRHALGADMRRFRLGRVLGWMNRALREPGYEMVLDCQGLGRSGLFARWTGAPLRIGFARPEAREFAWLGVNRRIRVPSPDGDHRSLRAPNEVRGPHASAAPEGPSLRSGLVTNASRPPDTSLHTVDRMLALVKAAGVEPYRDMRLYTGPKERIFVQERLGSRRYAVIAPTSRWPGKRWPADRFAAVAASLLKLGLDAVALVGGKSERDQCGPLLELASREPRVLDLVGATTVGELMALIQSAVLVIANDSAALHMAVGFNRPAIGLFGPTRVDLVGPYTEHAVMPRTIVLQHISANDTMDHKRDATGRALMERISADEVIAAIDALLAPRVPSSS